VEYRALRGREAHVRSGSRLRHRRRRSCWISRRALRTGGRATERHGRTGCSHDSNNMRRTNLHPHHTRRQVDRFRRNRSRKKWMAFPIRTMNVEDMLRNLETDRCNSHGSPSPDRDKSYRLLGEPGWVHSIRSLPFASLGCAADACSGSCACVKQTSVGEISQSRRLDYSPKRNND
jgi:hypothetical protein